MQFFTTKKIDSRQLINELIDAFGVIIDPPKVLLLVEARIKEIFNISSVQLLVKNQHGSFTVSPNGQFVEQESTLIHWLNTNRTFFQADNESLVNYVRQELNLLQLADSGFIFPIFAHNSLIALAVIERKSFSQSETALLETVFKLTALAYQNVQRLAREREQLETDFQQEKLASIGQMAASLAHEIKNPLTAIRSTLQFLEKQSDNHTAKELHGSLIEEVDRIGKITNALLGYSRPRKLSLRKIELEAVLGKIQTLQQSELQRLQIEFKISKNMRQPVMIQADTEALEQILLNLLLNSIEAMHGKSGAQISVEINCSPSKTLELDWMDNGCGISEEAKKRIFDPFYTTKQLGTGLGLAVTKQLVELHGWQISVDSKPGSGTRFKILIDKYEVGV